MDVQPQKKQKIVTNKHVIFSNSHQTMHNKVLLGQRFKEIIMK